MAENDMCSTTTTTKKLEPTLAERLQTARPFVALGFTGRQLWDLVAEGDSVDEAMQNARCAIQQRAEAECGSRFVVVGHNLPPDGLDVAVVRVEAVRRIYPVTQYAVAVALNETDLPLANRD